MTLKKPSVSQTIYYKYLGFSKLNTKHLPDFKHGNHRGSGIIGSDGYTDSSVLYLHSISLDNDSTDYDMKFKFYAKLIYKDGSTEMVDISSGGIELKSMLNIDVNMMRNPSRIRWINLTIRIGLRSIVTEGLFTDLRVVIIVVEQLRGATDGQEFVIHCEVKEF